MSDGFELIVIIVNSGYEDDVMEAVRGAGARGGTYINATGTAKKDAEQFFGIAIHPDKVVILIVVEKAIRDNVLGAVYDKFALTGEAQGVAFTLPIDDVSDKLLGQNAAAIKKEEEDD